jgi:holin-like protein
MNLINGLAILLVYQLIGEITTRFLDLPVPGPVLGMLLLFLTLLLRGGSTGAMDTAADGLLSHLSLLFVPAGVGMMVHFDRIAGEWLPIVAALLVSAVVTMVVTAGVMLGANRLLAGRRREDA